MNIPNLPFLEKKGKSEYFLSLILRDEKTTAVVFEELEGKINVVGEHEELFKTSLEDSTEEELLTTIDKAVSEAERSLPPDVESQKTIFGVKDSWIEEGKIKKDYLAKLKKVSDELEFKPVGFLVITEAIAHLLQKEEGAPVSAILAEIGSRLITVTLLKAGRIVETKSTAIHENPAFTVDTLLKHFTNSEILPSRVILFNGGSEKLQQDFISHSWSKSLPFLHIPQITNLPAGFDAKAVLEGAANQMGFEVLEGSLPQAISADQGEVPPIDEVSLRKEAQDKTLAEAIETNDFGFVENEDLSVKEEQTAEPQIVPPIQQPTIADQFQEIPEEVKINRADRKALPIQAGMIMAGFRNAGLKIMPLISKGPLKTIANGRKALLLPLIPLLLLIFILFVYFFLRSSVITLSIDKENIQKKENVTFAESQNSDISINLIKASFVSVSEDGKETAKTTGKKETGDKAKGTVTMFNNGSSSVTIAQGTKITSSNDLTFVTDKEIKVASASGDIFSGTKPGTTNVGVTAENFGTNYNLPSNTKFTVSGNSNVAAKNDNAFSGGTKKEIKVVSKSDLDKLSEKLKDRLESEAKEDIKAKIKGDEEILPSFIGSSFERKDFSKDEGDEADEISLTGTISFDGVSYKKSDILSFAKEKLKSQIDDKLTVSDDIDLSVSNIKKNINDEVSADLEVKANLIPEIDEKETIDSIKGKSISDAEKKLEEIPQVKEATITISLQIPLLPKRLPFKSSKIKIVLNNG